MPHALRAWFDDPDLLRIQRDDLDFYLPPSARREAVAALLGHIDGALLASDLKKSTRHTHAGIVPAEGGPLFIKRSNNWGLRYSLRYLFRPARCFRAAAAAKVLRDAGVHTPEAYGAGERRRGRYLKCCYLVTEALSGAVSLETLLAADPSLRLLDEAAALAAALHGAGIYHGDMKFINLYRLDDRYGVWDLDGVRLHAGATPPERVCRELGRILSSFVIQTDAHPALPDSFFRLAPLAERLLDGYRRHAPAAPRRDALIDMAARRWLRRATLRHRVEGMD
ncbi:MAG TPA: lipopolysaccharide kinase InaA family protein [Pseudomonas sp.]|nr:lipopolysaccharide kinase InaA family protein [Pseudomonas sp.]